MQAYKMKIEIAVIKELNLQPPLIAKCCLQLLNSNLNNNWVREKLGNMEIMCVFLHLSRLIATSPYIKNHQ